MFRDQGCRTWGTGFGTHTTTTAVYMQSYPPCSKHLKGAEDSLELSPGGKFLGS